MRVWRLGAIALLGVVLAQCGYAQCGYAQCGYAQWGYAQWGYAQGGYAQPVNALPQPAPVELKLVLVDINIATPAELTRVRFIGRNRAKAIIAGRPWKHPDELVAKRVMPKKVYDQIKDQLIAK